MTPFELEPGWTMASADLTARDPPRHMLKNIAMNIDDSHPLVVLFWIGFSARFRVHATGWSLTFAGRRLLGKL